MILLTAFAPFGPKGILSGTNASEVVLNRISEQYPGRYATKVLPARRTGLERYRELLRTAPWTGLLAMGESGGISSSHVVLERVANVLNSPGVLPPLPWTGTEVSLFATGATADKKGGPQSIGTYWCNQIYLEALVWARQHGNIPAAFVHIPAVLGGSLPLYRQRVAALYQQYAEEVLAILRQMDAKAAPGGR